MNEEQDLIEERVEKMQREIAKRVDSIEAQEKEIKEIEKEVRRLQGEEDWEEEEWLEEV